MRTRLSAFAVLGDAAMSVPIVLRPYQEKAVADVRRAISDSSKRVLLVSPTGSGKTVCFAYIVAHGVARGTRILILAHRQELLDQAEGALTIAGAPYGVIAAGQPETDAPVQLASVATLARRLGRWSDQFDLVVLDEAHHTVARSWAKVIASQPRARILGVTATPERLDGRGLAEQFDALIEGPTVAELIAGKWLSPFVVFEPTAAPDMSAARVRAGDFMIEDQREAMDGVIVQSAVDERQRLCPDDPTLVFCVDVEHSKEVAQRFREHGATALHVDGETPAAARRAAIAALGDGGLQIITNCSLFGEGVDVPNIGAVILLRPTASLALHLQMIGRSLRPAPGKDRALILDFAGNCSRHGLPDAPHAWSLDAKPRRPCERPDGPRLRRCKACTALNRAAALECSECGADLRTIAERREIEIALREAQRRETEDAVARMQKYERYAWAGADVDRLQVVARVSGYRLGWVYFRLKELAQLNARAPG